MSLSGCPGEGRPTKDEGRRTRDGGRGSCQLLEKARPRACVAHVAVAEPLHFHEDRVVVTIREERHHLQAIARGLALGPQLVARSAEERDEARVACARE